MMAQQAAWHRNARAFLFIEAVLATALVGLGAVMLSRGLGEAVAAHARLQETGALLAAAEAALEELEVEAQTHPPLTRREGRCAWPHEAYQWTMAIQPAQWMGMPASGRPLNAVVLQVARVVGGRAVTLVTAWPSGWLRATDRSPGSP